MTLWNIIDEVNAAEDEAMGLICDNCSITLMVSRQEDMDKICESCGVKDAMEKLKLAVFCEGFATGEILMEGENEKGKSTN